MSSVTQSFSQTILTYGPGAMLDLPDHAVIVGGLQDWDQRGSIIEEERLRAILRTQLHKDCVLRTPPIYDDTNRTDNQPGIGVRIFPQWFICDETGQSEVIGPDANGGDQTAGSGHAAVQHSRRRMVEWAALDVGHGGRLRFNDGGSRAVPVSPVRFVGACPKGHLQDLNWRFLVHRNGDPNCQKPMYWVEQGVSSDPADISVECTCGATMTLSDLYKPGFLGDCRGYVPWYGWAGACETCDNQLRLLSRSATNGYFPQTVTIISLPPEDDALTRIISEKWSTISSLQSLPNFVQIIRTLPETADLLKPFSDDRIEKAVKGFGQAATEGASRDPRIDEFDRLASGAPIIGKDAPDTRLYAQTLDRKALSFTGFAGRLVEKIVRVHRLREVTCLYGFSRLEPAPSAVEAELDEIQLNVDAARLAEDSDWLPATENFGEGLFLQFRADAMFEWLASNAALEAIDRIKDGEDMEAQKRGALPSHLGAAYWAIHSLSHALMKELSLHCGYPLAALKERIYASANHENPRFGLLIYTASTGGQGTLGGLSSQADQINTLLHAAKAKLRLCSNDPVCSEHKPGRDDDRPMHGAACHACLLIPETSCEARNERLDRDLLVDTISGSAGGLLE